MMVKGKVEDATESKSITDWNQKTRTSGRGEQPKQRRLCGKK